MIMTHFVYIILLRSLSSFLISGLVSDWNWWMNLLAYERSESARDNFGKFIHQFQPETKTLIGKLERILIKLYRQMCLYYLIIYIYIYIYILQSTKEIGSEVYSQYSKVMSTYNTQLPKQKIQVFIKMFNSRSSYQK